MTNTSIFRSAHYLSRLCLVAFLTAPHSASGGDTARLDGWRGTSLWSRYIRIHEAEQVARFNYMDLGPGVITDRDLQYRIRTRLQFNLAGDGATFIRMRAETGRGFDNSWDNTGVGQGTGRWNFNMKSFALGQRLGSRVELQAGGIEFEQGAGSQRTYASGDGHLTGYRVLLRRPTGTWRPDKFALTMGYLGHFEEPSVFSRLEMGKINYAQALFEKQIGEQVRASAEVDVIRGIWFTRQALQWRGLWRPLLDEAVVETVARATDGPSFGWSAMVTRHLDKAQHWQSQAIYAHIPQGLYRQGTHPVLLNQGEIGQGRRIAWGASHAAATSLEIGAFFGRRLDTTPSKRWIAQVCVRYQFAPLLQRLLR